jgi:hypothetical protein
MAKNRELVHDIRLSSLSLTQLPFRDFQFRWFQSVEAALSLGHCRRSRLPLGRQAAGASTMLSVVEPLDFGAYVRNRYLGMQSNDLFSRGRSGPGRKGSARLNWSFAIMCRYFVVYNQRLGTIQE